MIEILVNSTAILTSFASIGQFLISVRQKKDTLSVTNQRIKKFNPETLDKNSAVFDSLKQTYEWLGELEPYAEQIVKKQLTIHLTALLSFITALFVFNYFLLKPLVELFSLELWQIFLFLLTLYILYLYIVSKIKTHAGAALEFISLHFKGVSKKDALHITQSIFKIHTKSIPAIEKYAWIKVHFSDILTEDEIKYAANLKKHDDISNLQQVEIEKINEELDGHLLHHYMIAFMRGAIYESSKRFFLTQQEKRFIELYVIAAESVKNAEIIFWLSGLRKHIAVLQAGLPTHFAQFHDE